MAPVAAGKISPQIALHRQMKQRLGLETGRPDAERCALYTDRRLTTAEIEELESKGYRFHPDLWVPPLPGHHASGFHLVTIPYASLASLEDNPRVVRVASTEFAAAPNNNLGRKRIGVDQVHDGVGVAPGTGSGIVIAVADSGLDTSHPDLPLPLEAYDVTDGIDSDSWGTDVANTVIDHGTHVTGSALASGALSAGNTGNGGESYKGAAPSASLMFYKIGNDTDAQTTFDDMIEAVLRAQSADADIFTLSYGGWGSTFLDGSSPVCQAIDAAAAAGMTVFASAGNSAALGRHASGYVRADAPAVFEYVLDNSAGGSAYSNEQRIRLTWRDDVPGDLNLTLSTTLGPGESLLELSAETSPRGTESKLYSLVPAVAPGELRIHQLIVNGASPGSFPVRVHAYRVQGPGIFAAADAAYTVGHPALCDGAIAIGAWTQRDSWIDEAGNDWACCGLVAETLAPFSSQGPRVDGRLKPDIIAPGAVTISTRDSVFSTYSSRAIDNDGVGVDGSGPADYYALHGTSMATPLAAGAAALVLEASPGLKPQGVRNALVAHADRASSPDAAAGYGLPDLAATIAGAPAPGADLDGDWYAAGGGDCDDADPNLWQAPGTARDLRFLDARSMSWSASASFGGAVATYQLLRATQPHDFISAACLDPVLPVDRIAVDATVPAAGSAFFYLVRAVNGCPAGEGGLGAGSTGPPRAGSCSAR